MKISCLMHVDFEGPGAIASWAKDRGYSLQIIKPYREEALPDLSEFDLLIIMGGPQSANDPHLYLDREKDLIQRSIESQKGVLGFCLGAQLMGAALGVPSLRSPEKEVGVYSVFLTPAGQKDPLLMELPSEFPAIHWHNDMPGLPEGAIILAESAGCPRQIIRFAPKAYGFQCHLEITQPGMGELIEAIPGDLIPSPFIQPQEILLDQDFEKIHQTLVAILDRFVALP